MSRQRFRRTRNVVVGAVVSVGIAAGTWAVVRASGSTGSREGASYNVIKNKVNYGSKIVIRNDGPYRLKVTDMQNGTGVVYLPSCTMETYWPKGENVWFGPFVNEDLFPLATTFQATFVFDLYDPDPSACQHEWTGKVKGQFTDLDLQIEACVPLRGHLIVSSTASVDEQTVADNTYGCHLQNKHYDGAVHAWGLQVDRVKARSSDLGVHAISKDLQNITDNYAGKTEEWEFSAGYGQGMQFTVVASPHERLDPDNVYVYTLKNFGPPKCFDAAYAQQHLDCSE